MTIQDITARWDELLLVVGAIGVACEGLIAALIVLVHALRTAAGWLGSVALLTPTPTDDRLAGRLVRALDGAAQGLERLGRIIPRLRLGADRKGAPADTLTPRGTAVLGALLLIAATALGGCGMTAIEATQASVATAARLTTTVDPIVAAAYDDVTEGLDDGTLSTEDAAVRLRRLDRAERALGSMRHALIAVDYSIEAYSAGETCGLRAALDGAVSAAQELLRALDAAGLDVPDIVHIAAALASGYVEPVECRPDPATTAALGQLRAVAL